MIDAMAMPTNPVYKLHVSYMSCWKLEVIVQNTLSQGLGYITSHNPSISENCQTPSGELLIHHFDQVRSFHRPAGRQVRRTLTTARCIWRRSVCYGVLLTEPVPGKPCAICCSCGDRCEYTYSILYIGLSI